MTIYYSCYSTETDYIGTMMWNCSCKVGIGVALVSGAPRPCAELGDAEVAAASAAKEPVGGGALLKKESIFI